MYLMSFDLTGTPRGHRKLLENFVQLKVDNKVLSDENARLGAELAEVQHARGSITTVPVPGMPLDSSGQPFPLLSVPFACSWGKNAMSSFDWRTS